MRRLLVLLALISAASCGQRALTQGVAAFKKADYPQAVEFFKRAVAANPNSVKAHLYLGSSFMSMWRPSDGGPHNDEYEQGAAKEFRRVLELDANNDVALAGLASIVYNEAAGEERNRKLDEAAGLYKRLAAVDPSNKVAPYSMGVIAWQKWHPALIMARVKGHMKLEDPGPLPGPVRDELKAQYASIIEEGIANLEHALMLDPHYEDAMAYMNLLIRERADLRDTKEEYALDVAVAEEWLQKSLDPKKNRTQARTAEAQQTGSGGGARMPIQVGSILGRENLVRRVEAVYPPLAKEARIQGIVRFTITIAKDGTVQKILLVSGPPLLVPAARDALKQWVYMPTFLNGEPVEVISAVDIQFTLNQ